MLLYVSCANMSIALDFGHFISGAGFIKKKCIGNVLHVMNMKDQRNTCFPFYFEFNLFRKAFTHLDGSSEQRFALSVRIIYFLFRKKSLRFQSNTQRSLSLHYEVRRVRTSLRILVCFTVPCPATECELCHTALCTRWFKYDRD